MEKDTKQDTAEPAKALAKLGIINMETETKADKAALAKALANAQKEVFAASKDGKNPFFNSKYATLAEVLATVRAPLADNGFALLQDADTDLVAGTVGVVSKLLHESGAEICSPRLSASLKDEFTKSGDKLPPSVQQIGSMVTYLRRYSLSAFLSVAVEDDDGNHVTEIGKNAPKAQPQAQPGRTSAHTKEKLDTPAAVTRHVQAATQAQSQPPEGPPVHVQRREPVQEIEEVENKNLQAAMLRDGITYQALQSYLSGTSGEPRITSPILREGMSLNSLGERIVTSLLAPKNWNMVRARIDADSDELPY